MKAEPPLNAAAGLRSKIPLPPTRTSQSEKRSFVYVCTTSRRNFTSLFAVSFRPLLDPTLETHAIFSFSFSSFLFDHLLFHSLSLALFFFPFLPLSLSLGQILWNSSRVPSRRNLPTSSSSSSPPALSSSFILPSVFSPPLPSPGGRGFVGKRAPVDRPPRPPPCTQIDRHPWPGCPRPAITLARPEDPGRCRPG